MKLKSTFAAIAATTVLMGAVLPNAAQAKPCIFSQQGGITDSAPADPALNSPTEAGVDGLSRLGIVGAGFALLGSLLAGGMVLKRRFDRQPEPLVEQEIPTEAQSNEELNEQSIASAEPLFVPSSFGIEVPPEALRSIQESAASESVSESALTSVR